MTPAELLDTTPLRIGKYRDQTPLEVADTDPAYLVWAYDTWEVKPCSKLLYNACRACDDDDDDDDDNPDYYDGRHPLHGRDE